MALEYGPRGKRMSLTAGQMAELHGIITVFLVEHELGKRRAEAWIIRQLFLATLHWRRLFVENYGWDLPDGGPSRKTLREAKCRLKAAGLICLNAVEGHDCLNIRAIVQWVRENVYAHGGLIDQRRMEIVLDLEHFFNQVWNKMGLPMGPKKEKKPFAPKFESPELQSISSLHELKKEDSSNNHKREVVQQSIREKVRDLNLVLIDEIDRLHQKVTKPGQVTKRAVICFSKVLANWCAEREIVMEPWSGKTVGCAKNFIFYCFQQGYRPTDLMFEVIDTWGAVAQMHNKQPDFFSFDYFFARRSQILDQVRGVMRWREKGMEVIEA